MGVYSFRYNGLVNKAAVDVAPNKAGKGVILSTKKNKNMPAKINYSVTLAKDSRRTLKSIKGLLSKYKPAHTKIAQRRASKILISQKPLKPRKQKSDNKM